jgi:hypothetical protein
MYRTISVPPEINPYQAGGYNPIPIFSLSILLHLSAVRAHPRAGNELTLNPLVEPLHLVCTIRVPAELVFDVHGDVYNLLPDKIHRTKNVRDFYGTKLTGIVMFPMINYLIHR